MEGLSLWNDKIPQFTPMADSAPLGAVHQQITIKQTNLAAAATCNISSIQSSAQPSRSSRSNVFVACGDWAF